MLIFLQHPSVQVRAQMLLFAPSLWAGAVRGLFIFGRADPSDLWVYQDVVVQLGAVESHTGWKCFWKGAHAQCDNLGQLVGFPDYPSSTDCRMVSCRQPLLLGKKELQPLLQALLCLSLFKWNLQTANDLPWIFLCCWCCKIVGRKGITCRVSFRSSSHSLNHLSCCFSRLEECLEMMVLLQWCCTQQIKSEYVILCVHGWDKTPNFNSASEETASGSEVSVFL